MTMQLEYEAQRQAIRNGWHSDPDPEKCACGGGGWILSSFDTWEECPAHRGKKHPEDYDYEEGVMGYFIFFVEENTCIINENGMTWETNHRPEAFDDIPF